MAFADTINTPDLYSTAPWNRLVATTLMVLNQNLYDYQCEFMRCIAHYKRTATVASRQIGKSVGIAFTGLSWALSKENQTVLIISTGERQVKELLTKRQFSIKKIYKKAGKDGHIWVPDEYDAKRDNIDQRVLIKNLAEQASIRLEYQTVSENAEEIEFPNGSRIVVVPANPDTASGYTADLLIGDEVAKMPNWDEMQAACFPFVSRVDGHIALFSSYRGKNHWYFITKDKLSDKNPKGWKVLKYPVTVNPPPDIEQLRHDLPEERFLEEYMCVPIEGSWSMFPYSLIDRCSQGEFVEW